MRKLLLFFAMLCVSIGAWADSSGKIGSTNSTYSYNSTTKVLELNLVAANDLNTGKWVNNSSCNWDSNVPSECKDAGVIVINGVLGNNDAGALWLWCESTNYGNIIDFRGLTDYSAVTSMNLGNNNGRIVVIIPDGESVSGNNSFKSKLNCQNSNMWGATAQINGEELNLYFGNSTGFANDMEKDKNTYHYFDNITTANFYNENGDGVTLDEQVRLGINSLNRNITTVNAEGAILDEATWEMMNAHITTLNLADMIMRNNAKLKIGSNNDSSWDNQSSLANLNLSGATAVDVDASNQQSVVSIDLTDANITGHVNVTGLDLTQLKITMSDAADVSKIIPQTNSSGDPIDYSSVVKTPSNDPVEITVAGDGISIATIQAAIDALEDAPEGATNKNVNILHVTGTLTKADLEYINKNLPKLKLLDLSGCTYASDVTATDVANALLNEQHGNYSPKGIALIIPTPDSTDPLTGTSDMYTYQQKEITFAYYTDSAKKKLNVYTNNRVGDIVNLAPVVDENSTITFLPIYNSSGEFANYMKPSSEAYGKDLTHANVLGQLPVGSIDFTWVYYGADYCDYRELNPATHYIIVQTNSTSAEYDITDESGTRDFKYNDNIWVVATYKGAAAPYATQVYYDGRTLNTAPYSSANGTGFGEEGTTANITYIRTAGKLSGAANLVSDLQKDAERTVIVGNVAQSDITAINVMRNSVLDLSGAILQNGANLSTLQNSYIQYLALPYNSTEDVASFKASQCTGLLGVGKFDTTNKHLYLQSYQEGGMTTIMSCLVKATGIEYVTAAGEMNARDLAATTDVFDANGHFVFTETANSDVGKTLSVVTGTAQINGAAIQGALNGRLATGFKGLDISGLKLHQYSEEPSNGAGEYFSYDGTYQNDLHMSTLGYVTASTKATLEYLKLPVDQSVWRIPTSSMNDSKFDLYTFCIPGQYREIGSNAFNNDNGLFKITTTRVVGGNGSYDDIYEEYEGSLTGAPGGNTITLPPSLTKIESGAFGNVEHFTDVYVTSEEVPVCEMHSFGAGTYYGWGGYRQDQDGMAQRTDYGNESSDPHSKAFGVLHWTQDYTLAQVKKLTDIQRVYFHPDREGKTDDRGNLLHWPTLQQIQRAYALACTGYLDGAWMPYIDGAKEPHTDGGTGLLDNVYSAEGNSITQAQGNAHYENYGSPIGETYTDYIGWHQFVLVGSWSYADKYEQKPWNTICIPYNVTYDQLIDMYGVTKSVSANNKKIIVNSEGYPIAYAAEGVDEHGELSTTAETLLPTVSTLTSVNRKVTYKKSKTGEYVLQSDGTYKKMTAEQLKSVDPDKRYVAGNGLITLQFTEGMVTKAAEDGKVYNWKVNSDYAWTPGSVSSQTGEWEENADGIIMKAGYPYHLKVYVPLGTENIRTYAMNELEAAGATESAQQPYNEWIVPTTGNSGGDELKYKFKGYYDLSASAVALPMHSYFLWVPKSGESLWYRYEQSWGAAWGQNNPIASYAALIGLIGEDGTWPEYDLMLTDKTSGAQAKGMLVVDFGDGSETEATGIEDVQIDAEDTGISTGKVYNMNGQVVSETGSLQGLGKGIYIINGKKYIVK